MMQLRRQTNAWSCALYAYAMVLDVEPDDLIKIIGHDGSQIVFPNLKEPVRRRGFNHQELFDCAYHFGYSVMEIEVLPCSITAIDSPIFDIDFKLSQGRTNAQRFESYLAGNIGVLHGFALTANHAVAWDGETVYDPRGRIAPYEKRGLQVRSFQLFSKRVVPCSFD